MKFDAIVGGEAVQMSIFGEGGWLRGSTTTTD